MQFLKTHKVSLLVALALTAIGFTHMATFWTLPGVGADDILFALSSAHLAKDSHLMAPEASFLIPKSHTLAYWNPIGYAVLNSPAYVIFDAHGDILRFSSMLAYIMSGLLLFRLAWLLDFSRICMTFCGLAWMADSLVMQASHAPRPEMWALVCCTGALVALIESHRRRYRSRWLMLSGFSAGLGIAIHPFGVVWMLLGMVVVAWYGKGESWRYRLSWLIGCSLGLWPFLLTISAGSWGVFVDQLGVLMQVLGSSERPVLGLSYFHEYGSTARSMVVIFTASCFGIWVGSKRHAAWWWLAALQVLTLLYVSVTGQTKSMLFLTPGIYLGFFAAFGFFCKLSVRWRRHVYVVVSSLLLAFALSRGWTMMWLQKSQWPGTFGREQKLWQADIRRYWDEQQHILIDSRLAAMVNYQNLTAPQIQLYDSRWQLHPKLAEYATIWGAVVGFEPFPKEVNRIVTQRFDFCLDKVPYLTQVNRAVHIYHTNSTCMAFELDEDPQAP